MKATQLIPYKQIIPVIQQCSGAWSIERLRPSSFGWLFGRVLGVGAAVILLLCLTAFAADPAETTSAATGSSADAPGNAVLTKETAKDAVLGETNRHAKSVFEQAITKGATTGGVDPHGDSGQSIKNSVQQFARPLFMVRLLLSLALAVGCAWVIAWHPRSSKRRDPLAELEERKAFIILGVVGAIVAELSATSPTLAFVIFGIGALLRFRTVLDNPKATGKAILVVVIGLACGMGSWTMAVFVTAFCWGLLFWLDSHLSCAMSIRFNVTGDPKPLQSAVESLLVSHRCRLRGCTLSKGKKRLEFHFQMPAGLDREALEAEVRAKLPKTSDARVNIDVI